MVRNSPDVRKVAFANFVKRATRNAWEGRGWSVPKIAEAAGIGSNTIYRWLDGDWVRSPLPDQVVAFCDALDIPVQSAFAVLWPGKADVAPEPEPAPLDPDLKILLRKLADPNTPQFEREFIRESLRALAARPVRPAGDERTTRRGRRAAG